ncbi:MAG: ATP-binding protein, partial [Nanoarchaeota archaeon]
KVNEIIQVTEELNDENYKREINGLMEALRKYKLKSGLFLTHDQEREEKIDNKIIKIIPVWKWLLIEN